MSLGSLLTKTSDNVLLSPSTSSSFNSRSYSNFSFWLVTISPSEFHISPPSATSYFPLSAVTADFCSFTGSLNANKAKVLIMWWHLLLLHPYTTHKHTHAQRRISALIETFCWTWHLTKLTLFQTASSVILTKEIVSFDESKCQGQCLAALM